MNDIKDELDKKFNNKMNPVSAGALPDPKDLELEDPEDDPPSTDDQSKYDQLEEEARAEIQEMFGELIEELEKSRTWIEGFLNGKRIFLAGKYRIEVKQQDMEDITTMKELNEVIQKSNFYLREFVDLPDDLAPRFDFIKNLIFQFQQALMKEQARRFAILYKEQDKRFFITKGLIDYYLKGIHIHLSRIIGSLEPSGDYIVVVPPPRPTAMPMGDMMGMGGSGMDINNGIVSPTDATPFVNDSNWWNQGTRYDINKRGTRISKIREFGDKDT